MTSISYRSSAVHPRVRGDHFSRARPGEVADGSSPRSRGPPLRTWRKAAVDRFIPAFAGTTAIARRPRCPAPVHPRVRGDHSALIFVNSMSDGSSPRSRGPHGAPTRDSPPRRFIPAFAGTTMQAHESETKVAVHPRVRGDHGTTYNVRVAATGSSPRSRGPRRQRDLPRHGKRFIPAFAGTTRRSSAQN